jgi:hypothetical protein
MLSSLPDPRTGVRQTADRLTTMVSRLVVSREPVTKSQLKVLVDIATPQVMRTFELSRRGAAQAIEPILRRLLTVVPDAPVPVRRPAWAVVR